MKIERETHVLDATDMPVGRLATEIAKLLQGKHKPTYEPHIDAGDFVQIENVEKLAYNENRAVKKVYYRHSGYPGGLKEKTQKKLFEEDPSKVVLAAVSRMLPKNKLRSERMKRLTFKS